MRAPLAAAAVLLAVALVPAPAAAKERCAGPATLAGQPALVAVVLDGITSAEPASGTSDPTAVRNWCPVTPAGTPRRFPAGLDDGIRVWSGFSSADGKPNTRTCLPAGGLESNVCLVSRLADSGAIVLPYSYTSSTVTRAGRFDFRGYEKSDTLQPYSESVAALTRMLSSIAAAWPLSRVVVIAHSYGGTVASGWWEAHHGSLGNVRRVFTLDSPINGIEYCPAASVLFSPSVGTELCRRWNNRDALNAATLAADREGSFVPMAAPNDPTYAEPVSSGGLTVSGGGGLRDELLYRCPDDGSSATSRCIATPPSRVARNPLCDASGPGILGRKAHHLVIACPEIVRRIVAATLLAPRLSRVRLRGKSFRFTVSQPARVRIRFERVRRHHWRKLRSRLVAVKDAGARRMGFRRRLRGRRLRPGRYRATLVASVGRLHSPARRVRFRVRAPRR